MWSMPVVLTEWEKENDSQNQCNVTSFRNFRECAVCVMTSF